MGDGADDGDGEMVRGYVRRSMEGKRQKAVRESVKPESVSKYTVYIYTLHSF